MFRIPLMRSTAAVIAAMAWVVPCPAAEPPAPADVIFINGTIETLVPDRPRATAVAVKDERFIAVGDEAAVRAHAGPGTKFVDLSGRFVMPGLVDAHTHPLETMWLKEEWVDARFPDTPSVVAALEKIAARARTTPAGQWIYVACVSASENKFAEKRVPTKAELDRAAPDHPVIVANGAHMALTNSKGLAALGATRGVSHLRHGGRVLTDDSGEPNGVITDGMGDVPGAPTAEQATRYYTRDIAEFWNANGFTSVLAITPAAAVPLLQAAATSGEKPNIRFSAAVWTAPDGTGMPDDLSKFEMPPQADPAYHRFVGIKAWVDGENDCRTGFMREPYVGKQETDPPGGLGTLVTPEEKAERLAAIAAVNKKLCMLHCSGDAATDIGLATYEKQPPAAMPSPMRIEHFGMFQLDNEQLRRGEALAKRGLRVSVQPIWLVELVKADYENMGTARAATGYRFRSLIRAGLEPAAGTDMTGIYLGNIDPFRGVGAAVTRQSDAGIFQPEEAITVTDALRMWTIWPARAMGEGDTKGTIEVGKFADMAVLSGDPFAIPPEKLAELRVVRTVVGGRTVHEAQD